MGLEINEISLLNPPDEVYCSQLNLLRDIFNNDYENILMQSAIKNTALMFFQSLTGMGTSSNVQCISGNLELTPSGAVTIDEMDSITGWAEADTTSVGVFSLNTNSDHYVEATGSIDVNFNAAKKDRLYTLTKTVSSVDWSMYDQLEIWVKQTHIADTSADEIALHVNGTRTTATQAPNGSGYYTFDISAISRSAVTSYGIDITLRDAEDHHVYFDLITGVSTATYNTSGWWQCPGRTVPADITSIFAYEKIASLEVGCSYLVKISLDGGTNWHTLTEQEYGSWVDVTAWSEYGDFTVKNNFSMRVELATTDDTVTPQYDDIMVAYKMET